MTVWQMQTKQTASIDRIDESLHPTLLKRLREIGLDTGLSVMVLKRSPMGGPIVLQMSDCVFSIEQSIAEKIFVSLV